MWCSQSDDHSENSLAKYGYNYTWKQKNESFYILGYLLELNIKSGEIGSFYEEKSFSMDQNHTFQVEIWQNFAKKKKNHHWSIYAVANQTLGQGQEILRPGQGLNVEVVYTH